MDIAAIAETTVEMWVLVNAKLIARQQDNLDPEIQATILSESMKLYMTHIINEKKYGEKTPEGTPKDPNMCYKCGKYFSDGELDFLKGKTGQDRICYHCSH